jgi:hypothetical protein
MSPYIVYSSFANWVKALDIDTLLDASRNAGMEAASKGKAGTLWDCHVAYLLVERYRELTDKLENYYEPQELLKEFDMKKLLQLKHAYEDAYVEQLLLKENKEVKEDYSLTEDLQNNIIAVAKLMLSNLNLNLDDWIINKVDPGNGYVAPPTGAWIETITSGE